jgi:hypothetical protein
LTIGSPVKNHLPGMYESAAREDRHPFSSSH